MLILNGEFGRIEDAVELAALRNALVSVLAVGAHVAFATATIVLAFLAAIGTG